jgi:hypothetical protein
VLRPYSAAVVLQVGDRVVFRMREGKQGGHLGGAVQVDPVKPTLKAPGTKRLKLKCDQLLSIFAFKFNLGPYTWAYTASSTRRRPPVASSA